MNLTYREMQVIETEMLKKVHDICEVHHLKYWMAYGSVLGAVRHGGPIPWDNDADIIIPYSELERFVQIVRRELPEKFYLDFYDINEHYPTLFPRIGLKGYSSLKLHLDIFLMIGLSDNSEIQGEKHKRLILLRNIYKAKTSNRRYFGDLSIRKQLHNFLIRTIYIYYSKKKIIKKYKKLCSQWDIENPHYTLNTIEGYGVKGIIPFSLYGQGRRMSYSGVELVVPEKAEDYLRWFYGDYRKLPLLEERTKVNDTVMIYELQK